MNEENVTTCTKIKDLIDEIGTLQTAWGLIAAAVLVVVFFVLVLTFTNRINNATKQQIKRFQKDGKYLPDVYIELNNGISSLFPFFV